MKYSEFLPKVKIKKSGIMVRPDKETCLKLEKLANKHGCSTNALVVAIIKEFFTKESQ